MKPSEAADLLTRCAAYDNRQPSLLASKAWAAALEDVPLDGDTFAAVDSYYGSPPDKPGERLWMQPHHVRTHRRIIRSERLTDFVYIPQPGDEDPRVYLANRRRQLDAVADGLRPPAPARPALPPGQPFAEALADAGSPVGRRVPGPERDTPPGSPTAVRCPTCHARIGQPCRAAGRLRKAPHGARRRVAAGEPVYRPDAAIREQQVRAASAAALTHTEEGR